MAVGPPRRGLHPGSGKQPGHSITYTRAAQARFIRKPSALIFPGTGLYTLGRWIRKPSTMIKPGADLIIRLPRSRARDVGIAGNALAEFKRVSHGRKRTLAMSGVGAHALIGTPSSAHGTKMSVDVYLADAFIDISLADALIDVTLESFAVDVTL